MVKEIITIIRCDICGREGAECFSFRYDRRMDNAGSMENVYYDADLCRTHEEETFDRHGRPSDYRERDIGRSKSIAHGSKIKEWIQQQIVVWKNMSPEERCLALKIEEL